ncbi:MAG: methyl-accepting chemotaxis protein [Candidatus Eremiobacteraeota bacterium]|jgi:methyl-accepting chemotaxis protein|nr:methyl-accepting chemotaxis protein [Candidatus Eremiobacteraeota bacterium]
MVVEEPASGQELEDVRSCARWLGELERTRDLTAPLAGVDESSCPAAALLRRYVDALRCEMLDFRAIVEQAAEIAALNADQLDRVVANTSEQSAIVERTASAIAEIDQGAEHVARTTESLRTLTGTLAASADEYDRGIDSVLSGMNDLVSTVEAAAPFAAAMESGAAEIRAFLERLRRVARQARVLGINAAIEAAHLGDAGHGFVIVADEVKQLAGSTSESAADVATIEKKLQAASRQVESAIGESAAIVRGLAADLDAARDRSSQTREQVRQLDRAIGDVAAIVGQQSASLSGISANVEQVARHALEVANAAERAARLAIGDALERLQNAIGRYRLGDRRPVAADETVDPADLPLALRQPVESLRARVDADQLDILTLITAIAVSIARNSYEWRSISTALASLRSELGMTTNAIDETAKGAEVAAQAAQRMRTALDAMRAGFAASVNDFGHALERVVLVRDDVRRAETFVLATSEAADRAAAILDLIDTISSETTLLSLNAAIEAAHAGTAGSGFGVIANEIRSLAETTSRATQEISAVIAGVSGASRSMTDAAARAVAQTADVHDDTTRMQASIGDLRVQLDGTLDRSAEVAGIVEQQLVALADVRRATDLAVKRVESDSGAATDGRRIELAMLGMRAHALAARRPLGTSAERVREIGLAAAAEMDGVFDAALDRGALKLDDCFDTAYAEITGSAVARLGRLFDVSKVPAHGFDPPKFETRYDRAVEDGFNRLIDAYVPRHPSVKAMFAVDLNGYCFGHFRECRQAWTGDYVTDLNNNRIKRFFEDDVSLRCSRVGLGDAALLLPARTPYARFRDAGCSLRSAGGERPWAIFTYARDSGIVYNDLSVALFARAHRVATIRIIYDADVV